MTREQRRSKSRFHNHMKRRGYRLHRGSWRFSYYFLLSTPIIYHSDHEEAK